MRLVADRLGICIAAISVRQLEFLLILSPYQHLRGLRLRSSQGQEHAVFGSFAPAKIQLPKYRSWSQRFVIPQSVSEPILRICGVSPVHCSTVTVQIYSDTELPCPVVSVTVLGYSTTSGLKLYCSWSTVCSTCSTSSCYGFCVQYWSPIGCGF